MHKEIQKACYLKKLGPRSGVGGRGEVAQTMYTHVSKCKNDKIKERRKT
jgi:hypothetical protein